MNMNKEQMKHRFILLMIKWYENIFKTKNWLETNRRRGTGEITMIN